MFVSCISIKLLDGGRKEDKKEKEQKDKEQEGKSPQNEDFFPFSFSKGE